MHNSILSALLCTQQQHLYTLDILLLESSPACPQKHSIWHADELLTFGLDCFLVWVFSLLWVKSLSTSSPICADSLALPPCNIMLQAVYETIDISIAKMNHAHLVKA